MLGTDSFKEAREILMGILTIEKDLIDFLFLTLSRWCALMCDNVVIYYMGFIEIVIFSNQFI